MAETIRGGEAKLHHLVASDLDYCTPIRSAAQMLSAPMACRRITYAEVKIHNTHSVPKLHIAFIDSRWQRGPPHFRASELFNPVALSSVVEAHAHQIATENDTVRVVSTIVRSVKRKQLDDRGP